MLELTVCRVDLVRRTVRRGGASSRLTALEARLLSYLVERAGQVVRNAVLLQEVWGYSPSVESRAVAHTVKRLRVKIERDPSDPDHLLTEYGHGYRFESAVPEGGLRARSTASSDGRPISPGCASGSSRRAWSRSSARVGSARHASRGRSSGSVSPLRAGAGSPSWLTWAIWPASSARSRGPPGRASSPTTSPPP